MMTHVSLLSVFNEMTALREENWLLRQQAQKLLLTPGEQKLFGVKPITVQLDPYEGGMPSLMNGGHKAAVSAVVEQLIWPLTDGGYLTFHRGLDEYKLSATIHVAAR